MGLSYICCAIQHNVKCGGDQMKTSCSCWGQSLVITHQPEPHAQRERKEGKGKKKERAGMAKILISGNLCRVPINYLGSAAPMTE